MPVAPQTESPSKRTRTVPTARCGALNSADRCPWICPSRNPPRWSAGPNAMYRAKELDQLPGVAISGGEYRVGTTRLLAMYGLTVGPKPE